MRIYVDANGFQKAANDILIRSALQLWERHSQNQQKAAISMIRSQKPWTE